MSELTDKSNSQENIEKRRGRIQARVDRINSEIERRADNDSLIESLQAELEDRAAQLHLLNRGRQA